MTANSIVLFTYHFISPEDRKHYQAIDNAKTNGTRLDTGDNTYSCNLFCARSY